MMRTFLVALALIAPLPAFAQSACSAGVPLTMRLESELTATVPSASVGVYAILENTGSEILRGASIAVEVVEKETGTVVDRFVVPQDVVVFGGGSAKVGFVWKVPDAIADGAYTIEATYAPAGAPRAAISSGAVYPTARREIMVSGGSAPGVTLESLAVNGQSYARGGVARMTEGNVVALARAGNPSGVPYVGTLTWRTYAADAALSDKPLDERSYPAELHPDVGRSFSYDVPEGRDAYYVEGEFRDGQSSAYFIVLLESGTGAFPWAACAPLVHERAASKHTSAFVAVVGAVLVLGLLWELYERRRRHAQV